MFKEEGEMKLNGFHISTISLFYNVIPVRVDSQLHVMYWNGNDYQYAFMASYHDSLFVPGLWVRGRYDHLETWQIIYSQRPALPFKTDSTIQRISRFFSIHLNKRYDAA